MLPHRCYTLLFHVLFCCWQIQESIQLDLSDLKDFDEHVSGLVNEQMGKHDPLSIPVVRISQLYSKASGKHIRIYGKNVDARGENGDVYARLILQGDNLESQITIRGNESGFYLCLSPKGKVVGRRKRRDDDTYSCTFKEQIAENKFTEFRSVSHPDWILAFKKDGEAKNARRVRTGHKTSHFLKRQVPEDAERKQSEIVQNQNFHRNILEYNFMKIQTYSSTLADTKR
ncbi:fibroblast growth factor 18-like [Glandiceps talaboti]